MNLLLTGAAGRLGQALQETLTGKHSLIALDRSQLDITQLHHVREALRAHRPELVINTAAYTDVDRAESEGKSAYQVNALGPRNLALATHDAGIPLLHVSTDYVFDGTSSQPYHEFDRPNPLSTYGASKLAGEEAVRTLNARHYIIRTAWLYHHVGKNFPLAMYRQISKGEVRVVNDQFGSPTYAPHLAEAISHLIQTGAFGTFHFAGQGRASWSDLTQELYRQLGVSTRVIPVSSTEFPRPAPRPHFTVLTTIQDPSILLPPWEEGLAIFVGHLTNHPST